MRKSFYTLVATVLALLILVLPVALSARERRGAYLEITLKDGHYVVGELIAVKPDSLLLLNPAGTDDSVDLVGINIIRIVYKSKAGRGLVIGGLAGALIINVAAFADPLTEPNLTGVIVLGALGAIPGALVGLAAGSLAGKDKTIQLEGKSESEVRKALAYLRGKARIRDFK
jgi:hypothetical protein